MAKPERKADEASEVKKLKRKLNELRQKLKHLAAPTAKPAPRVSPLAPKTGFPALPEVAGIRFSAAAAGVRYRDRLDVMLAVADPGSTVAGAFTRSATRSACVRDCQAKLATLTGVDDSDSADTGLAIIANSGNANAFTGAEGVAAVQTVTGSVARALGLAPERVFSSSTGVIGEALPAPRITAVVDDLVAGLSTGAIADAVRAIMTTDTFAKGAGLEIDLDGTAARIVGIAKGSGMIAPDMGTMLAYIFTDAAVSRACLQRTLSGLIAGTFNAITVDSDTSTSDTVLLIATGRAKTPLITDSRTARGRAFKAGLGAVMLDLAQQIVRDGEGATKFIEVRVTGASSDADARKVARAIANSPLVKTAAAGEDPNWGRVVMAIGKSGAVAERDRLTIRFGDILVATEGHVAPDYSEAAGADYMKRAELTIAVDLQLGRGSATVWTCDLTHDYIAINADYRS